MAATTDTCPAGEAVGSTDRSRARAARPARLTASRAARGGRGHRRVRVRLVLQPARSDPLARVRRGRAAQPLMAQRMPRGDVFGALHPSLDRYGTGRPDADPDSPDDPELRSFRSGFWGLVRRASRPPAAELDSPARRARGRRQTAAELARIAVDGARRARSRSTAGAGRRPARRHLHGHLRAAARAAAPPARLDPGADAPQLGLRDLGRLLVARALRGSRGRGRGRSPLRGVALAGAAPLLPELRARPRARARRGATSCHVRPGRLLAPRQARDAARRARRRSSSTATRASSSATASCLATPTGASVAPTTTACLSLLMANSVTGAASLFRRDLLDYALPFPPRQFTHFHDHWLGLCAGPGRHRLRRPAALRLRPARERGARACRRQPDAAAARPARQAARGSERARPELAAALLRRLLPADAVHDDPRDALRPG